MVNAVTCVTIACRAALNGHEELLLLIQENLLPLTVLGPAFAQALGGHRLLSLWLDAAVFADIPLIEYTAPALYEAIQRFKGVFLDRAIQSLGHESPLWARAVEIAVEDDAQEILGLIHGRLPRVDGACMEIAMERGNVELLEWLHGRRMGRALTIHALWLAAKSGSIAILEWLATSEFRNQVCQLPKIERDHVFHSALEGAVESGHLHVVQWLLAHFPAHKWTAEVICKAVVCRHREIADYLFENATLCGEGMTQAARECDVMDVFARGDMATLVWFHEHGILSCVVYRRFLEAAKTRGHINVLEYLETNASDAFHREFQSFNGSNAEGGSIAVAQWALKRGRLDKSLSCVYGAARSGHIDFIRWYLAAMENEDIKYFPNYHAVAAAAEKGSLQCVEFLVLKGWGSASSQSIVAAAEHGHLDVLEWLVLHGAEPTSIAGSQAAAYGHLNVVKWLHAKDCVPCGAIRRAAYGGHAHIVQWLLGHTTPTIDEVDAAVFTAVQRGHFRVVRMLPWSANCDDETLVDLARENGHVHVAKWIERFRASPSAITSTLGP